jgi:radical SAM protein with 4Fe4S-binding SPASM domain
MAFHHCKEVGQKVGLRFTLSAHNIADIDGILDFIETEEIDRVCFYHLVYSGRGSDVVDVTHEDTRRALYKIIDRTARWADAGTPREVLTVDQPADGAYIYMRMLRENPEGAAAALDLLRWNGGGKNASGTALANIDTLGKVHPDQFWQSLTLGNVKEQKFSDIWTRSKDATLAQLRDPAQSPGGKCADCQFLSICGGGFRVRTLQVHGEVWAPDPACYLTEAETQATHAVA